MSDADVQIVACEDEEGSAKSSASGPQPGGQQVQMTLRRFWQPEHPAANTPAVKLTESEERRGRPISAGMKKILEDVRQVELARVESGAPSTEESQLVSSVEKSYREFGRAGGRPRLSAGAPVQRRCKEIPVAQKALMASEMDRILKEFPAEKDMLLAAKRRFNMPVNALKKIWVSKTVLAKTAKEKRLSANPSKFAASKGVKKTSAEKRYRGFRLKGAGRKQEFPAVYESLRNWFDSSRSHGHSVLPQHLISKWEVLLHDELLNLKAELDQKSDAERAKAELLIASGQKQLDNAKKPDARKQRIIRLKQFLCCKNLKPDLVTKLSPEEESVRAMLTWQSLDRLLYKAVFAPLCELEPLVCNAKEFRDNCDKLVLICSDQIPLWVKMGAEKELFASWEFQPVEQSALREALQMHHEATLADRDRGQALVKVTVLQSEPHMSGQRQKRALRESSLDRYRVTYEARQAVLNLCAKPDATGKQKPVEGVVLPGLLVVHGTHCRLNNISESGKWISDESYFYNGRLHERKAGQSAGKLMISWRKARSANPALFQKLSVMTQPSANVDSIIFAWATKELSAQFGVCIHQRDCFSAAWSEVAQQSLYLAQSLQSFISPGMTASLQLTDTDFSRSFKNLCKAEMTSLRSEGQKQLLASGSREPWRASVLNFASVVVSAQNTLSERNLANSWVLGGLRRNGILAYQPDWQSGKLVCVYDENLTRFDMGSGRLKTEWLKDRYLWVDSEHAPLEPDYSLIAGAKAVADLLEWSYHNPLDLTEKATQVEDLMNVDELPLEFQLPCIQSGTLVLPLDLHLASLIGATTRLNSKRCAIINKFLFFRSGMGSKNIIAYPSLLRSGGPRGSPPFRGCLEVIFQTKSNKTLIRFSFPKFWNFRRLPVIFPSQIALDPFFSIRVLFHFISSRLNSKRCAIINKFLFFRSGMGSKNIIAYPSLLRSGGPRGSPPFRGCLEVIFQTKSNKTLIRFSFPKFWNFRRLPVIFPSQIALDPFFSIRVLFHFIS